MSYRVHMDGEFTLDRPLTVEHKVTLEKFADERHEHPGSGYPDYPWCQWLPNELGTAIVYTDSEISGYEAAAWLAYLADTFLALWGYTMNGSAKWSGEEGGDLGIIVCRDNEVREAEAVITYPDPFEDDDS